MTTTTRLTRVAAGLGLTLTFSGCALFAPAPPPADRDPAPIDPAVTEAPAAECQVIEVDAMSEEVKEARERTFAKVKFRYGGSDVAVDALVAQAPQFIFVMAHGWQNDVQSSREFSSDIINGLLARAQRDGVDPKRLGFIAIHWDSKRPLFHESAVCAEVIGKKRVAPLLATLATRLPAARVVLVGHSLGGRLMLSALGADGPPTTLRAHAAVLLEAAADHDALLPERSTSLIGGFPLAPGRARIIVNVHSRQDDVLELAYKNAMRAIAIGREGAERMAGERFATYKLTPSLDFAAFEVAAHEPNAQWPGATDRTFVNVDATAVVAGHSEVMVDPVFDLIWRVAGR
jgi:hypothetical protein